VEIKDEIHSVFDLQNDDRFLSLRWQTVSLLKIGNPKVCCFVSALLLLDLQPVRASDPFPAQSVRVIAVIDGADILHLSKAGATWTHQSWSWPTDISINGYSWDPQQKPTWTPPSDAAFLRDDLDLSGAVFHIIRGRGTVTCERDTNGFIIHFDDPQNGSDTYEITIDFAQMLVTNQASSSQGHDLQFRISAKIDGSDELWLLSTNLEWKHTSWSLPENVTVNGQPWDLAKTTEFPLAQAVSPESMDLQRATLQKFRGRGTMNLDYLPERFCLDFEHFDPGVAGDFKTSAERLCLDFEDPPEGADWYEGTMVVPRFRERYLVRLIAHSVKGILGTPLRIYRFPSGREAQTVLAGQRFFGPEGECIAALEPGQYQFEALHQDSSGGLIALRTGVINISGPTNIDFQPQPWEPSLVGPYQMPMTLDNLAIRSSRPGGAITWQRPPGNGTAIPSVALSKEQSYRIHAFGHSGANYVAVWTTVTATNAARITIASRDWLEGSFIWRQDTPRTSGWGILLEFPDGKFEISNSQGCRLFTNRRFFTVAYWLDFPGNRRAIFEPRPCFLTDPKSRILLGGKLHPLASAAILQDEKLGRPDALALWSDITLGDAQGYLLDTASSTIDWTSNIKLKSGAAIPPAPLPSNFADHLTNIKDQLIASATYWTDIRNVCAVAPEALADVGQGRFSMKAPPYRSWNTMNYLAKAERELSFTFLIRGVTNEPEHHLDIKWWLNDGAVGGGNSITMPMGGYLLSKDWYSHPWAIAHEMLHNFGFGHTHEMNRVDAAVQEQMDLFRWSTADDPAYLPAGNLRQ